MSGTRIACWHDRVVGSAACKGAVLLLPALLVALLGWVLSLRGLAQAHQAALQQGQGALQQLAAGSREAAGLGEQQLALAAERQALRDLQWRLDAGQGISGLLDQLTLAGREHGVRVERVELLPEQPAGAGYRRLPLQLQVQGRYPALRAWLGQAAQQLRLLEVSRISLSPASGGNGLVGAQVQINAYQADQALPAPAALADEPARPAVASTAFDPFWPVAPGADALAQVPLEQLTMVGSLARAGRHQALVRAGGRVYRVSQGQRLGREQGVVMHIDARRVAVRERLYMAGTWQEQTRYLALGESMDEEHETDPVRTAAGVRHELARGTGGARG